MLINNQWLKDELTDDEFTLFHHIIVSNTTYEHFDTSNLECIRPIMLQHKFNSFKRENLNDRGQEVFQNLVSKIVEFGNFYIQ